MRLVHTELTRFYKFRGHIPLINNIPNCLLICRCAAEEWGGRGSRRKLDHILSDLLTNCDDQWKARNDLHVDTLDVYLLECLENDFGVEFENDEEVTVVSRLLQQSKLAKPEATRSQRVTRDDDEEDSEGGCSSKEDGRSTTETEAVVRVRHQVDEDGWETIVAPRKKGAASGAASSSASNDKEPPVVLQVPDSVGTPLIVAGGRFAPGGVEKLDGESAAPAGKTHT